ncbi:MAG TPA: glycosyltransferase [Gemmataceae bacterium]|nr:glycosyltransferase [Gemmataceae bacterium]
MRVLAITNLYPNPYQPYRAPFNRHQLRILGERLPVRVIAPIAWTDEWRARRAGTPPLPAGLRIEFDGLTVDHPRYLFPPKVGRGWYGHWYRRSIRTAFRAAIEEFRPDIVFAPWAYPDGWAAGRLARSVGLPVVLQVHGSDVLLLDQFPARRRRTAEALRAADGIVAVSQDLAGHVQAFGVDPARILVNYDGVDPALFHPSSRVEARARIGLGDGEPVVLFVGNLLPVKAVDVLIRACDRLARTGFPVRLIAIGQGPLRPALEGQAAERGLAGRVTFTGPKPLTELPDWYRAADVFCLPSHSEGVPNVLLEASACGTPWVASRVGGIPEIAHLGRSRLVPPNSPDELAAAIRGILTNPPVESAPGPRDRRAAVDDLQRFLESVCGNARPVAAAGR